ncbi:MAG: SDR family oxidoreductase [bacterium]|nr:SDR family oxidoreductase [bacterium]
MKIFISGASSGLGKIIAENLINSGHSICTASRTKPPFPVKWIKIDLSNLSEVESKLIPELFDVDVIINNAGILAGLELNQFNKNNLTAIANLNLLSPVLITTKLVSLWIKENRKYGRVINIGSTAEETGHPDISYSVTKLGLRGLTLSIDQLIPISKNIHINHITIGPMKTSLINKISPKALEYFKRNISITGGYVDCGLVAKIINQLLKRECKIRGQILRVHNSRVGWNNG